MPAPWNGSFCVWREENGVTEVLIEETWFPGSDSPMLRFVGGKKRDIDNDPFETAVRELREEAGLQVSEWDPVIHVIRIPVTVGHFQDFFAIHFDHCRGSINFEEKIRDDGRRQVVKWYALPELMGKGLLFKNHAYVAEVLAERLESIENQAAA